MRAATKAEYKEALSRYETGGQYALYEYASERGITSWEYKRGTFRSEAANEDYEESFNLLTE
jgi:hypothetical protein